MKKIKTAAVMLPVWASMFSGCLFIKIVRLSCFSYSSFVCNQVESGSSMLCLSLCVFACLGQHVVVQAPVVAAAGCHVEAQHRLLSCSILIVCLVYVYGCLNKYYVCIVVLCVCVSCLLS